MNTNSAPVRILARHPARRTPTLALVVVFVLACADGSRAAARDDATGREVARVAARFLAHKPSLRREDCSGLVNDVLRDVGADPSNARGGTRHHWERAHAEGRIATDALRAGDLVFFDRTYDANHNGRVDDSLTHIAIVVDLASDGTVVMVHRAGSGIDELRMNLRAPAVHVVNDAVLNSPLKTPRYGSNGTPRLTGQLYRGHARPPILARPPTLTADAPASASSVPEPTPPIALAVVSALATTREPDESTLFCSDIR